MYDITSTDDPVYGLRASGSTPVFAADNSTLLTDKTEILSRWADHFNSLLNKRSVICDNAFLDVPTLQTIGDLDIAPNCAEVTKALKQLSAGKAAGPDGIPPEVYKFGGAHMASALTKLFGAFWAKGAVPQDLKDASIIHLYKRKGNRALCDNHRGISLLSIAGKILAKVVLNRLTSNVIDKVYLNLSVVSAAAVVHPTWSSPTDNFKRNAWSRINPYTQYLWTSPKLSILLAEKDSGNCYRKSGAH